MADFTVVQVFTTGLTLTVNNGSSEAQSANVTSGKVRFVGSTLQTLTDGPEVSEVTVGTVRLKGNTLYVVGQSLKGSAAYIPAPQLTVDQYYLSNDIDTFGLDYWFPHASDTLGNLSGGGLTRAEQTNTTFTLHDGTLCPTYFDDFYNRIHITPNPINFGAVFSEQGRTINVWNAYISELTLASITPANDGGLTLTGQSNPPLVYHALQERSYSLALSLDGPAVIDATYAFDFGVAIPVLVITGTRITVFPFAPNWKQPVVERLEWLTDVMQMRNGNEQRLRLRQNPRQSFEYEILVHGKTARLLNSLLFGWQGRSWGVPMWPQMQRVTQGIASGITTIPCVTDGYEFKVGDFMVLYSHETAYETAAVASVSSNSITLATPTTLSWNAGTFLIPLKVTFMRDPVQVNRITGDVGTAVVRFFGEQFIPPASTVTAEYNALPVLKYDANRVNDVTETWERVTNVLDYATSNSTTFDRLDYSSTSRAHELLGVNLTAVKAYRNFLYYACGRWKPFWSHTMNKDFKLAEDVPLGQEYIIVEHSLYVLMVKQHGMRNHIRIATRAGNVYYREILGSDAINTPAGTEKLTLNAVFPEVLSSGEDKVLISFLQTCRLDTDVIEINWIMPAVANFALRIKGVTA